MSPNSDLSLSPDPEAWVCCLSDTSNTEMSVTAVFLMTVMCMGGARHFLSSIIMDPSLSRFQFTKAAQTFWTHSKEGRINYSEYYI